VVIYDVSNLAHTGMWATKGFFYEDIKFQALPFIFSKVANYTQKSSEVTFAFDPEIRGEFHTTNPLKPNRRLKPDVLREINTFLEIAKWCDMRCLRLPGVSADDLIYSFCQDNKGLQKWIVSADKDLACNVDETTSILSFSSTSYNIDIHTFEDLMQMPFNLTNVEKSFRGCQSDAIKGVVKGNSLWQRYLSYHSDNVTPVVSTKDYLLSWVKANAPEWEVAVADNIKKVFPVKVDTSQFEEWADWDLWNAIAFEMFGNTKYFNSRFSVRGLSEEEFNKLISIIQNTSSVRPSIMEPNLTLSTTFVQKGDNDLDLEI